MAVGLPDSPGGGEEGALLATPRRQQEVLQSLVTQMGSLGVIHHVAGGKSLFTRLSRTLALLRVTNVSHEGGHKLSEIETQINRCDPHLPYRT